MLKDVVDNLGLDTIEEIAYTVMFACYLFYHLISLPANISTLTLSFLGLDISTFDGYANTMQLLSLIGAIFSGIGWILFSAAPFAFLAYADSSYYDTSFSTLWLGILYQLIALFSNVGSLSFFSIYSSLY